MFTHLFISLPSPDEKFVKELSDLLYDFVWNGKSKIKKSICVKEYVDGGLKMIDVKSYIYSMKIKWLRNYCFNSDGKCYKLIKSIVNISTFQLW